MNRITELLSILAVVALFMPVHCGAQHMDEKDSPCATAVTTLDLRRCFSRAKESSDAKLTAVYEKVLKRLEGDDLERLTNTQRIWSQYRDANCSAERALYDGGTAALVVYLACLDSMTRARTKELQLTYAVRLKN